MGGEAPEVIAGSTEARLHFIGHAQPPGRTDLLECRREVAWRRNQYATAGENQIEVEGGRRKAPHAEGQGGVVYACRVAVCISRVIPAESASITIRGGDRGDVFGERSTFAMFGGRELVNRVGGSVVGHPRPRWRRSFAYALLRDATRGRSLRFPSIRTCRSKDHRAGLR